jgi:N-acyl-D-aspartate/D-glutamate deacylase
MLDLLLRNGEIVDGTGRARYRADIGICDGRIVSIGHTDEPASRTLDVDGLVVAPGVIDIHTHYDAQLMWDPAASPSPLHGVTSVVGGNCGFSIAPLGENDADYIIEMMAVVEGIPRDTLRSLPWDWLSFGDFLDRFERNLGINAGFLVGHSTLRRAVMGEAAVDQLATDEQLATMTATLHAAIEAGALGWSGSRDDAHMDGDGHTVPARTAAPEELIAMAQVLSEHPGTILEFIPAIGEISRDRMELMAELSLAANRPLNWNLLGGMSPVEIYEEQLTASDLAASRGGRVIALAIPDMLRVRANNLLDMQPEFAEVNAMPDAERRVALQDPAVRRRLEESIETAASRGIETIGQWHMIEIAEARSPESEPYVGMTIEAVARERGADPVDVLIDVVLPEQLPLTMVLPSLVPSLGRTDEAWRARAAIWQDERVVLGGSDAGAHLDLLCHANYPTVVLGDGVRERELFSLETAVRMMTDVPARLYGFRDRGRVAEGAHADLMIFDPDEIATEPLVARFDLPGGGERLFAEARGIDRVLVAGREVVDGGKLTGDLAGTLLKSGIDTDTVSVPGTRPGPP